MPLEILIAAPLMPVSDAQHLVRSAQHTLDDHNDFPTHHLRLKLADSSYHEDDFTGKSSSRSLYDTAALTVKLQPEQDLTAPRSVLHADTTQLDIFYPPNQAPVASSSSSKSILSMFIADELQALFSEEKATIAHILSSSSNKNDNNNNNAIPETTPQTLRRSLRYAETYHLSFSLFTPGPQPSSWDVETAIQQHLSPLLHAFAPIHNFTIDTQVQIYATFAPTAPQPEFDESLAAWTLRKEDLSAFINAAEWPLSPSIGPGPTIYFVLYVPDARTSPLLVKENRGSSWVIPQWGGVVVLNPGLSPASPPPSPPSSAEDKEEEQEEREGEEEEEEERKPTNPPHLTPQHLQTPFLTFSHQLLSLLGVPITPPSLPLRLQSLARIRSISLLLSASSTLGSLARLTNSLPSIPIPAQVAAAVDVALSRLARTCVSLRSGGFVEALASARVADGQAERGFFEKSMVGQVYFPDEHKVAVYLPLLGPVGVPLVVGLVREVVRVVRERVRSGN